MFQLNKAADQLATSMVDDAAALRVQVHDVDGARVIDVGVDADGGLEAGRRMAEVCMAGLGQVTLVPGPEGACSAGADVVVRTDQPVAACMAAQYAGWKIALPEFFAMGSGPMRAVAAKEDLFTAIGHVEQSDIAVGALETAQLPSAEACRTIAGQCGVALDKLTLLAAPTASQAGTLQVVARSVETALHKMHELGFDLKRIQSGFGSAPLPPVAADDLTGIGRTNDAILYGGQVTLWIRGDDASLREIGPLIPSCASKDHGAPFAEIFERYGRDFYRIDRRLFSPAVITLANLDTGRSFRFGHLTPDILQTSFGIETN